MSLYVFRKQNRDIHVFVKYEQTQSRIRTHEIGYGQTGFEQPSKLEKTQIPASASLALADRSHGLCRRESQIIEIQITQTISCAFLKNCIFHHDPCSCFRVNCTISSCCCSPVTCGPLAGCLPCKQRGQTKKGPIRSEV